MTVEQAQQLSRRQFGWLVFSASAGSMFEWYDFFLAATAAAIVFPQLFFPKTMDPTIALAVSYASVGLAYFARPVGAMIFGHIGDKYGRRNTLVLSILLMGIGGVCTGLLPGYSSVGIAALVALFILRFVLGLGVGGEGGNAFSWIAEARSNDKHRGFWVTWPNAVLVLGKTLSVWVFYAVLTSLPRDAWLSWGWRVPFLLGGVLIFLGLIIRIRTLESPMFQQLRSKRSTLRYPSLTVLKEQGGLIFTLLWVNVYTNLIPAFAILPYSVSYLTKLGISTDFATLSVSVGSGLSFFAVLSGAYISDYIGRLKAIRIYAILSVLVIFPYFWLLNTLNWIWILVGQGLCYVIVEFCTGVNKAIFTENFPTKYRASGAGLCYEFSSTLTGIMSALVLPVILLTYGIVDAWQPIAWISVVMVVAAIVASIPLKETKGIALTQT